MSQTKYLFEADSFFDYSDNKLVELYNDGVSAAFTVLTNRYLKLIHSVVSKYRIAGLESEDLTQEGLLGLLSAVKTYDGSKGASFRTYAGLCINRRIITLLKSSDSSKYKPLNDYVSIYDDGIEESFCDHVFDPEELYIVNEALDSLQTSIAECLSSKENQVLMMYLAGDSYAVIADKLHISSKSVDNALQRIRRKLRKHISDILP